LFAGIDRFDLISRNLVLRARFKNNGFAEEEGCFGVVEYWSAGKAKGQIST